MHELWENTESMSCESLLFPLCCPWDVLVYLENLSQTAERCNLMLALPVVSTTGALFCLSKDLEGVFCGSSSSSAVKLIFATVNLAGSCIMGSLLGCLGILSLLSTGCQLDTRTFNSHFCRKRLLHLSQ